MVEVGGQMIWVAVNLVGITLSTVRRIIMGETRVVRIMVGLMGADMGDATVGAILIAVAMGAVGTIERRSLPATGLLKMARLRRGMGRRRRGRRSVSSSAG